MRLAEARTFHERAVGRDAQPPFFLVRVSFVFTFVCATLNSQIVAILRRDFTRNGIDVVGPRTIFADPPWEQRQPAR